MALVTDTLALVARTDAHEGPVHAADEGALYFTSLPAGGRSSVRRLDLSTGKVTTVVADANRANGMTMDGEGHLIVCEQGGFETAARITRLDRATSRRETLVEDFGGRPLNSPNDVVVASDGAIWFTDPSYGHLQGFRPPPQLADAVYRYASGRVELVARGFDKPNGLAFSPDERTLYVTDSGTAEVIALGPTGRRRFGTTDVAPWLPMRTRGVIRLAPSRCLRSNGDPGRYLQTSLRTVLLCRGVGHAE